MDRPTGLYHKASFPENATKKLNQIAKKTEEFLYNMTSISQSANGVHMLKTILIDDEEQYTQALERDLKQLCREEVQVVAKCHTALDALRAIKSLKPDLVILDVEMPEASGFEILELAENTGFEIIFFTNHSEHAVKAFEYSAIHFLWKPAYKEKLTDAIKRAMVRVKSGKTQTKSQLDALLYNLKPENLNKRIGLPISEGYKFLGMDEIQYLEADGNFCFVYGDGNRPLHISRSMGQMEEMLCDDQSDFFRIHASFLINRNYLAEYRRGDGGEVVLKSGKHLPVARARKEEFIRWMGLK